MFLVIINKNWKNKYKKLINNNNYGIKMNEINDFETLGHKKSVKVAIYLMLIMYMIIIVKDAIIHKKKDINIIKTLKKMQNIKKIMPY